MINALSSPTSSAATPNNCSGEHVQQTPRSDDQEMTDVMQTSNQGNSFQNVQETASFDTHAQPCTFQNDTSHTVVVNVQQNDASNTLAATSYFCESVQFSFGENIVANTTSDNLISQNNRADMTNSELIAQVPPPSSQFLVQRSNSNEVPIDSLIPPKFLDDMGLPELFNYSVQNNTLQETVVTEREPYTSNTYHVIVSNQSQMQSDIMTDEFNNVPTRVQLTESSNMNTPHNIHMVSNNINKVTGTVVEIEDENTVISNGEERGISAIVTIEDEQVKSSESNTQDNRIEISSEIGSTNIILSQNGLTNNTRGDAKEVVDKNNEILFAVKTTENHLCMDNEAVQIRPSRRKDIRSKHTEESLECKHKTDRQTSVEYAHGDRTINDNIEQNVDKILKSNISNEEEKCVTNVIHHVRKMNLKISESFRENKPMRESIPKRNSYHIGCKAKRNRNTEHENIKKLVSHTAHEIHPNVRHLKRPEQMKNKVHATKLENEGDEKCIMRHITHDIKNEQSPLKPFDESQTKILVRDENTEETLQNTSQTSGSDFPFLPFLVNNITTSKEMLQSDSDSITSGESTHHSLIATTGPSSLSSTLLSSSMSPCRAVIP